METRHHYQVCKELQGLCCNGKISSSIGGQLGDLHWRALVHVKADLGITVDKGFDNCWQDISGLSMGCGDTQVT